MKNGRFYLRTAASLPNHGLQSKLYPAGYRLQPTVDVTFSPSIFLKVELMTKQLNRRDFRGAPAPAA
jgi:hypothetical protein